MSYEAKRFNQKRLMKCHNLFVETWLPRLQKIMDDQSKGWKEIRDIWGTLMNTYSKAYTVINEEQIPIDEILQTYMKVQDQVRATFMAEGYIYIID